MPKAQPKYQERQNQHYDVQALLQGQNMHVFHCLVKLQKTIVLQGSCLLVQKPKLLAQIFHRLLLFLIRADVSACEHLIALYSTLFPLNKSSFWQDGWPSTLYYLSSLKVVVFA